MTGKLSPLAVTFLKQMGFHDEVNATPHSPRCIDLVRRAKEAAAHVEETFEAARKGGKLKDINKKFKAERLKTPGLSYAAYAARVKQNTMVAFCAELIARRARF